ncbi:hypothetical protein D3C85_1137250 [compost metagenome]
MGQPEAIHGAYWWPLHQAVSAHQRQNTLIHRRRQVVGLFVGIRCNQRYAKHDIGLGEHGRRLEVIAVYANGLMHVARGKVRCECIGQATLACQLRAEQA